MGNLKLFWMYLGSLVGLLGGWLAASQANVEWAFVGCVGVAALAVLIRRTFPRLGDWITAIRNYERVASSYAELKEELENERNLVAALNRSAGEAFKRGEQAGRADVRGSLLSVLLDEPPELEGMTEKDGEVLLLAKHGDKNRVQVGARFVVEDATTGSQKGIVEMTSIEDDTNRLFLKCVNPIVPKFWEYLREQVPIASTLPSEIRLTPYEIDWRTKENVSVVNEEDHNG